MGWCSRIISVPRKLRQEDCQQNESLSEKKGVGVGEGSRSGSCCIAVVVVNHAFESYIQDCGVDLKCVCDKRSVYEVIYAVVIPQCHYIAKCYAIQHNSVACDQVRHPECRSEIQKCDTTLNFLTSGKFHTRALMTANS